MKIKFYISLVCVVAMMVVMIYQGKVLVTPVSPNGILNLELAGTESKLLQLKLFWNLNNVRTNIYLDFLFILAYTSFFVIACKMVSNPDTQYDFRRIFISLAIVAGILDIVENFLMLMVLSSQPGTGYLKIIYYCALLKFLLVALVLFYLVRYVVIQLIKRINNRIKTSNYF